MKITFDTELTTASHLNYMLACARDKRDETVEFPTDRHWRAWNNLCHALADARDAKERAEAVPRDCPFELLGPCSAGDRGEHTHTVNGVKYP